MSEHLEFERTVAGHIASEGASPPSEAFYEEVFARAAEQGPRPTWLALIKEPPMRTNSRVAVGSPTFRVAAIMAATILLAVALAAVGIAGQRLLAAEATTIVVAQDGSGDHVTISAAVAAADDGDEILVMPGTYAESIVIDKDIALRGEARDDVVIDFGADCVFDQDSWDWTCPEGVALASRERVTGFTEQAPFGIHLVESRAEVGNLSIVHGHEGFAWSIGVHGGAPLIHDVSLLSSVEPAGGYALIWNGSGATIRDSEMGWLSAHDLSPVTVTGSVVWEMGINETNSGATGGEAVIQDNDLGAVSLGGPVLLQGNRFPESMGPDVEPIGVYIATGSDWVIKDNVIQGRQTGVQAFAGGTLEGNVIERNGIGLYYTGAPPAMTGNRICDNTINNVRGLGSSASGSTSAGREVAEVDTTANEICPDPAA